MKVVIENSTAEIVEKKSRFIANVFYIESVEEEPQELIDARNEKEKQIKIKKLKKKLKKLEGK